MKVLLSDNNSDGFIIHLFSNGGALVFEQMLVQFPAIDKLSGCIHGVVIDSAPVALHLNVVFIYYVDAVNWL